MSIRHAGLTIPGAMHPIATVNGTKLRDVTAGEVVAAHIMKSRSYEAPFASSNADRLPSI
jgi:hypothetical protein